MSQRIRLPIDSHLELIRENLRERNCLVLRASPGSGKTTRVPPALLADASGEILVLEPRRLAAKYAANRVAEELGERPGETVGYQFRFENVSGPRTKLRYLTEGMLMRRLLRDPELAGVSAVLLDEFHERHLHGDIALAYLRDLQLHRRPELRIVVMSATLDTETVASFLGDCPVVSVDAPVHPVSAEYLPSPPAKHLELLVREAVASRLSYDGDILVFLPGMAEIRRAAETLEERFRGRELLVLPLHGELTREEQDRAIRRADRKKIILSTNVAETSLTIEGVTTVIDSGLHRVASYSWWSGVPALRTRPISQASAIQRAGRAGRTAPGHCVRLYTKGEFDGRARFDAPEVARADITQTVLELKSLGVRDALAFPWFEAPSERSVRSAIDLLYRLGALVAADPAAELTGIGRRLVEIPAHPRLARALIEAEKSGVLDETATIAALISEGRLESLDALDALRSAGRDPSLARVRKHLLGPFREAKGHGPRAKIASALLTGFPDRVARKRSLEGASTRGRGNEVELIFSSGGSALVENAGVIAESEYFVALDMQERKAMGQARAQLRVHSVCAIEPDWLLDLEPSAIREVDERSWDDVRKRVARVVRMQYDSIILDESRQDAPGDLDSARILLKAALGVDSAQAASLTPSDWILALSRVGDPEQIEAAMARLQLFAERRKLPAPDFSALILETLTGKTSLTEVKDIDWGTQLPARFAPEDIHGFEQLLPTHFQLPGGRRARVHYKLGQPPWLESRLQDFFGMKKGPSLMNGALPLTLHLLAPNHRAVQVTSDLEGFWARNYPTVRRELSRRYPRHAWPENPLEVPPKRG